MSAQHTPGRQCVECEGFCLVAQNAGVALNLHIGQHVRHRDYDGKRVTGTVYSLGVEDRALMATIALDLPIVIAARDGMREIRIYKQTVPTHELTPFDDRDELIAEMLEALTACAEAQQPMQHAHAAEQALAVIAKATGTAS